MKCAIISDIHANLPALKAVLDSIRDEGVDKVFCLGDIVGFHTSPGECIDLVQSNEIVCIAGNHDDGVAGHLGPRSFPVECWEAIEWTQTQLTPTQRAFLCQLPKSLTIDGLGWVMHGMFGNNRRYLVGGLNLVYTSFRMKKEQVRIVFHGHTHHPSCYRMHGGILPINIDDIGTSRSVFLSPHAYYVVNPGSVGAPRQSDTRATYVILDTSPFRLCWKRISYDYQAVVKKTMTVFPSHAHLHMGLNATTTVQSSVFPQSQ